MRGRMHSAVAALVLVGACFCLPGVSAGGPPPGAVFSVETESKRLGAAPVADLFRKGGPIMWPLLFSSLVAVAVVGERLVFIARERRRRDPDAVEKILASAERGDFQAAIQAGASCRDFVARTLVFGLTHREHSFANALLKAANLELKRFSHGLSILDTIITLAPLLGLLGTVTGMIHSFGLLGGSEIEVPSAISGGIAEALIATAFGLGIAITALIPFNYLNGRLEEARHEIEDAANSLELLLMMKMKTKGAS